VAITGLIKHFGYKWGISWSIQRRPHKIFSKQECIKEEQTEKAQLILSEGIYSQR